MNMAFPVNQIREWLITWQTLAGAFIGAMTPLFILFIKEKHDEKKARKEYLYYLERLIVDQLNMIVEVRNTTQRFLNVKIERLLANIERNPDTAYSVDSTFFPLFSVRELPEDIHKKTSGSGYIDNLVGKAYSLSNDLPHIIADVRLQLRDTLEQNQKIAFGRLNTPEVQKEQYKRNILEFTEMIENEILAINIPIYIKKFAETLVAVREKNKISSVRWKIRFDPRWKFYINKPDYLTAKEKYIDQMESYFRPEVLKLINEALESEPST